MDRLKGKIAVVTGGASLRHWRRHFRNVCRQRERPWWWLMSRVNRAKPWFKLSAPRVVQPNFASATYPKQEEAAEAIRVAASWNGRIDVLCNNAAYMGPFHAVLESTALEWDRCIRVALLGTHYFTREALPYMVQQKSGSIINLVSIQAMVGCMTSVSYTATKAALLGYTLSASYDYGPHNVRVNSLCPGPIRTRISPKAGDPHYQWQCDQTMLGRVGYPKGVAYAATFLASDEASYITGVTLPVDGGWTAK